MRRAQPRLLREPHRRAQEADGPGIDYRILFLDAADEKLIARYKSSRRRHPLCADGASIAQGIERERDLLFEVREIAHHVIDTTDMLPPQLRATIRALFAPGEERTGLAVTVYSFGFKHGAPLDADLVMDVRFLPNPYYEPQLRALTGLDAPVRDFVMYRPETEEFRRSGAGCSTASCPATWPRASSSWPSPWDARAASTAAWRSPRQPATT